VHQDLLQSGRFREGPQQLHHLAAFLRDVPTQTYAPTLQRLKLIMVQYNDPAVKDRMQADGPLAFQNALPALRMLELVFLRDSERPTPIQGFYRSGSGGLKSPRWPRRTKSHASSRTPASSNSSRPADSPRT
jgi:hypothetical protein